MNKKSYRNKYLRSNESSKLCSESFLESSEAVITSPCMWHTIILFHLSEVMLDLHLMDFMQGLALYTLPKKMVDEPASSLNIVNSVALVNQVLVVMFSICSNWIVTLKRRTCCFI